MNIMEKVGYLKGLVQGLKIDESTKEGEAILAIVDVLDEIALSIEELNDSQNEMSELVDILDQDLGAVEEDLYGDGCDCCDDDDSEEEELYEVVCPNCGEEIYLDEDDLDEGEIECPECGSELEFDMDSIEVDGDDSDEEE